MAEEEAQKPPEEGQKSPVKEVKFYFEYDKDYRVVASNGVWGGITPRGDLQLDFFVEKVGIPDSVEYVVTQDGKLEGEIRRDPPRQFVRRMQVGVLFSLEDAERLHTFLGKRINELKKMIENG
jgi:hypothetical protein